MLDKKSKEYKQTINFHVQNYKFTKVNKLRSLSSKKTKHYWKFLNNLKPSSRDDNTPTLHEFYEHFKNINCGESDTSNFPVTTAFVRTNYELNSPILSSEIESCISNLNNGKACSPTDNILNEYTKNTKDLLLPLYTKLFNCVLDTGFIPISWVKGVIIPVFKNKGDPMQTQNYRPITILSCLGKLFTSIINKRLTKYLESNDVLDQNQAGFRSGYCCQDHIFTLYSIIEYLKKKRKQLFCAYIDFSSAFDKVHRASI